MTEAGVETRSAYALGHAQARADVWQKVRGEVRYAGDFDMRGMVYAKLVRSLYPSALVASIDVEPALAHPEVLCVLTARDVPHNQLAEAPNGEAGPVYCQPVLASERVRYVGEPLAIVVAQSPQAAEAAAGLVRVDYQVQPAVFDPLEALRPDAPKVHEQGNACVQWVVNKGDLAAARRHAEVTVQGEYRTQFVDHAYLEPETGVAWLDNEGHLVIRAATQVVEHYRQIADILGMAHSQVRVLAPYVGGGFGGKEDMTVEPYVALVTWKTGRPCKMVWSRTESLQARPKRHPMILRYDVGSMKDGTLVYMDVEIIGDAGAYAMLSPRVMFAAAVVATGPYRVPHVRVTSRAVYTNNVPTSAFRGFGAMQAAFGYEMVMDQLATSLAHDRLELRAKNFLRQGETLATGERLETAVWLPQCLDAVKQALGPKPRPSAEHKVVGRGWAANLQPYGRTVWFDDHAACWMNLEEDGSVVIRIGVPDVGGGQAAALCQIAAEVLKLPPSRIRPYFGDSALTPLAGGTFATRQLYMSGHAVLLAARTLRRNILETASAMMHVPVEELDLDDGVVKAPTGAVPLRELVRRGVQIGRPLAVHETFFAERGPVFDNQRGRAVKTFPDYTYGVHGCDVEVDVETGAVRILRYVAAHDVGRAINPLSVEGQIQGGVAQGIGYALSEEVLYQNGQCLNSLFAQYLIPTAQDVPPIHPVILESGEGKGPFHARGIGEPAISPVAAAIANAVADAIGVRITALPITAEKIVRALQRLS